MCRLIILILLLSYNYNDTLAQDCSAYQRLIKEANKARLNQEYPTAIKKFNLAMLNCPDSVNTVQQAFFTIFNEIERLKDKAEIEKEKADSALNIIKIEQAKIKKIIDAFYFYKDQFALAYKDGKYGFIDKEGNEKITYKYLRAEPFDYTGLAKVKTIENGKLTDYLIDTTKKEFKVAYQLINLNISIEALDLRSEKLEVFPIEIAENGQLKIIILDNNINSLSLTQNQFNILPKASLLLKDSTSTDLNNNQLNTLPEALSKLTNLKTINLSGNQLKKLPTPIPKLFSITTLNLSENNLSTLPVAFGQLNNLKTLNLSNNQFKVFSDVISKLENLTWIDLSDNRINTLLFLEGQLENLATLDLRANNLDSIPSEIAHLKNLTALFLSENQLTSLPKTIVQLESLTRLDLNDNSFKTIPEELIQLQNLSILDLRLNYIKLNDLKQLQKQLPNCKIYW